MTAPNCNQSDNRQSLSAPIQNAFGFRQNEGFRGQGGIENLAHGYELVNKPALIVDEGHADIDDAAVIHRAIVNRIRLTVTPPGVSLLATSFNTTFRPFYLWTFKLKSTGQLIASNMYADITVGNRAVVTNQRLT